MRRVAGADLPSGIAHGFTTRAAGSMAPGGDATVSDLADRWAGAVAALDHRASVDQLVLMSQVHGGDVLEVRAPTGPGTTCAEVDAIVTAVPGLVLAVRVADCVPVLFAAPTAVAAAHAGWRGVAAGVVPATMDALARFADRSAVVAIVGPHISGPAYQVGGEVVAGIEAAGVPRDAFAVPDGDRYRVDLGAAVDVQLRAAGVERVHHLGCCTTEDAFYSYRHDGRHTGRLAGLIGRWT